MSLSVSLDLSIAMSSYLVSYFNSTHHIHFEELSTCLVLWSILEKGRGRVLTFCVPMRTNLIISCSVT